MLTKLGSTFYNGAELPVYLLQGTATQDGEWAPVNNKDHGKVSVAAANNRDGSTTYVTINGWRSMAHSVARVCKLDRVLAIGTLKAREYNDKKYYDLDADFICLSGVASSGCNAPEYSAPSLPDTESFAELPDGDGMLPF